MIEKCLKTGRTSVKVFVAENTIEYIQKALEFDVEGIEMDAHLGASGEWVVFHDVMLGRMTNGTGELGNIHFLN